MNWIDLAQHKCFHFVYQVRFPYLIFPMPRLRSLRRGICATGPARLTLKLLFEENVSHEAIWRFKNSVCVGSVVRGVRVHSASDSDEPIAARGQSGPNITRMRQIPVEVPLQVQTASRNGECIPATQRHPSCRARRISLLTEVFMLALQNALWPSMRAMVSVG